jgi:PleD family two-component response regulator
VGHGWSSDVSGMPPSVPLAPSADLCLGHSRTSSRFRTITLSNDRGGAENAGRTSANGRHPDPTTHRNPGRRGEDGEQSALPVRVFIVDDHVLFRSVLRALLQENGLDPVGYVGDAERALDQIVRLQPDLVLMDPSCPGCREWRLRAGCRAWLPTFRY